MGGLIVLMDNNVIISIGQRISDIRKANGMTQEALADHLDISPKHVSHVERGASSFSIKNLIEFCALFNCSLDYILLGHTENSTLSKLPAEIVTLLNTGSDEQLDLLNRYLEIFIQLQK